MHKIEQAIQVFLENIEKAEIPDALIEEFGENCKKAIRECLLSKRSEEPFSLRMSNIGRPLRQLMLDKLYGRVPMGANQKLRMTYGYIWESFMFFLLKASGLNIETNKKVTLDITYDKDKKLTVDGTYDLKYDGDIYDVKSASSWSFDNKFISLDTLQQDDTFGYVGQGIGYSLADKSPFGGWIVIDKSDGRIKVVPVPKEGYRDLAIKYLNDFRHKIRMLNTPDAQLPPCDGEVEETFSRKLTGNKCLTKACEFCDHKYKCHPELKYMEATDSKAAKKTWKFYTKLKANA